MLKNTFLKTQRKAELKRWRGNILIKQKTYENIDLNFIFPPL